MDMLDRMLGHDAWATGTLLEISSTLSSEQLRQRFDIGHGSVLATLAHIVGAIDYWVAQMEQREPQIGNAEDFAVEELAEIFGHVQGSLATVARKAQAETRLDELFTDLHGYQQSIGGTVLHVLYHSAIHRSEVQHMLRRLGVESGLDFDPQEWEYGMRERGLFA